MNLKLTVLVLFAVMGVLLVVVMLGETLSSDWTTIAQEIAPVTVLIVVIGIVGAIAFSREK